VAEPELSFAGLLRQLRTEAKLTQEELAEAAALSPRSVSDLERGVTRTTHKDTGVLLAGALGLPGPARALFVAAARGKAGPAEVLTARQESAAGAFAAAAIRALPRDIAAFTGRQAELAQLMGTLAATAAAGGGAVGIHAIDGMAGIGKTTFAVHAAHRLAGSFPDGQFFLPLHAHTPGQRPIGPADALASLLLTAGVAAAQIPPGLDARAGRWRDYVAGKKVLLLLDDAAGHEQVRPLLPGTAGSLVLVTSRRRLAALHDAAVISLDTLPPREAAVLLARLAARGGIGPGDAAVAEITRLCAYLPLAIAMLASQLRHHPAQTGAGLAADLAAAKDRLALMHTENLSVAAAFDLSYTDLTPGTQRLFRRLGLVPGPDFDAYAAAALNGTTLDAARRSLNELYDQHLLAEPARGRYQLHDLLREHARGLAETDDLADRDAATDRLLDYYLHTALAAGRRFASWASGYRRPPPGRPPAHAPDVSTLERAAGWLEAERANLHAAANYAATQGRLKHATQIPAAVSGYLAARGHWDQFVVLLQAALAAAREAGDRPGEADTLGALGVVQAEMGDYPAAAASHQQALALARSASDRPAEAAALLGLGLVRQLIGDYPAAAASQRQALALFRDLGDLDSQADALNCLGIVQHETGDYRAAAASQQQSLTLCRDLGNLPGQAYAINDLGLVQQETGDYRAAAASHQQALTLFSDLGDRLGQAQALNSLGELATRISNTGQAGERHTQALAIARDLGAALEEARALEGLGRSHLYYGDPSQAAAHLQQALAIYQRIGAPAARRVQQSLQDHKQASTTPQHQPAGHTSKDHQPPSARRTSGSR
jgi:tetratricopeptide (TPR) repeat protein/transcriptional regulator with XRE-family HTH domain